MAKKLIAIFAGVTGDDKTIVIYQHRVRKKELHVQLDDGEIMQLSPEAEFSSMQDITTQRMHITIKSPEWTGRASAWRKDLIELRR
jgi:uncharacterized protein YggU (UPF0235/DUF167 family)